MHGILIDLLGTFLGIIVLAALVILGIVIIIFLVKMLILLLPAGLIAFAVWMLTGDLSLAIIAFIVVAIISLVKLL
ncbi:MAG TPA: hypothetical protein ENG30_03810 [Thermofilaceae archaeon]|nr:hypothetical protein [Thermofilaceae archaeon]